MKKIPRFAYESPEFAEAVKLHQAGRLQDATTVYKRLLLVYPADSQLISTLGALSLQMNEPATSVAYFDQAIAIDPTQAHAFLYRGIALNRLERFVEAIEDYDAAIALQPGFADALCNKGNTLLHLKRFEEALLAYDAALAIKPDFILSLYNSGNALREMQRFAEAAARLEAALHLNPNFAPAYLNLGITFKTLGRFDDALLCYDRCLALQPNNTDAFFNRGNLLLSLSRYAEALVNFEQAIALKADFSAAILKRIETLIALERLAEALAEFDAKLQVNTDDALAFCGRGQVLHSMKDYAAALQSYEQAIELDANLADAFCNQSITLLSLKRYADAIKSCEQAIAIVPDYAEAFSNKSLALMHLKRFDEALVCCEQAIAIKADFADAYNNRGTIFKELSRYDEALSCFESAIRFKPGLAEAYLNIVTVLQTINKHAEALPFFDKIRTLKPDFNSILGLQLFCQLKLCDWRDFDGNIAEILRLTERGEEACNPFNMLAFSDCLTLQKQCAEICVKNELGDIKAVPFAAPYAKHSKIRIAYFSEDFRFHPVAFLSVALFEGHSRDAFEVFGFSFTAEKDAMHLRLVAGFDEFIDILHRSDEAVLEMVREREIDIAINLGGHTGNNRNKLFAMRLAPIQLNFLGYAGTMGADFMDYIIADKVLIPEDKQAFYSEKVLYLPHCYMPTDDKRVISERVFSRSELGLPENGFVFCCFNNAYKITPLCFKSWMRILAAVPDSVLWIPEDSTTARENLLQTIRTAGIAEQRLIFAERLADNADYLARLKVADLFLDTWPYNAHTTACDALWVGLPVLTVMGESFACRVAASLLSAIELPELICGSVAEYEALAIELAGNAALLAAYRARLAQNRLTSPLFDTALYISNIESAYQSLYATYHADKV